MFFYAVIIEGSFSSLDYILAAVSVKFIVFIIAVG